MILVVSCDTERQFSSMKSAAAAVGISPSTMSQKFKRGGGKFTIIRDGVPCHVIQQTRPNEALPESLIEKIINTYDTDQYFYSQIAEMFGLSKYTVKRIVTKKRQGRS